MKKEKFLQEVARLKGNTNLKSQRIDLGLNQDLEAKAGEVSLIAQDADALMSTVESSLTEAQKVRTDLFAYQDNLTELQTRLVSKNDELYDLLIKVMDSAAELGISEDDIPGYNSADDTGSFGEDTKMKIDDTLSEIYDALP